MLRLQQKALREAVAAAKEKSKDGWVMVEPASAIDMIKGSIKRKGGRKRKTKRKKSTGEKLERAAKENAKENAAKPKEDNHNASLACIIICNYANKIVY